MKPSPEYFCPVHDDERDLAFVKIKGVAMKLKDGISIGGRTVYGGYEYKGKRNLYLPVIPIVIVEAFE